MSAIGGYAYIGPSGVLDVFLKSISSGNSPTSRSACDRSQIVVLCTVLKIKYDIDFSFFISIEF
jgi:hypothetical protein